MFLFDKIIEAENLLDYMDKRSLINQYKKAKSLLLNWDYKPVDFRKREPKDYNWYISTIHILSDNKSFNFVISMNTEKETDTPKSYLIEYKFKQSLIDTLNLEIKAKVKIIAYKYKKNITKKEFLIKGIINEIKKYP